MDSMTATNATPVATARDSALDLVKWLAMLSMLLDHLRHLWPQAGGLFIVGRMAFPLFCLAIAANVARSRRGQFITDANLRYLAWLLAFSVLSELPFRLLSPLSGTLNVMPTLMLGLLVAWGVHHRERTSLMLAAAALLLAGVLDTRLMYGAVGVLLPAALLMGLQRSGWWWLLPATLAALANSPNLWWTSRDVILESLAVLATAFVAPLVGLWLLRQRLAFKVWPVRRWGYFFYPLHLAVIQAVRVML